MYDDPSRQVASVPPLAGTAEGSGPKPLACHRGLGRGCGGRQRCSRLRDRARSYATNCIPPPSESKTCEQQVTNCACRGSPRRVRQPDVGGPVRHAVSRARLPSHSSGLDIRRDAETPRSKAWYWNLNVAVIHDLRGYARGSSDCLYVHRERRIPLREAPAPRRQEDGIRRPRTDHGPRLVGRSLMRGQLGTRSCADEEPPGISSIRSGRSS